MSLDGLFEDKETIDKLNQINAVFTFFFIAEMGIKLLALGPAGYTRDRMNIFDGAIVLISIFELIFFESGNKAVTAFKAVRILR